MTDYRNELKKVLALKDLQALDAQLTTVTRFINEKDLAHLFIDSIYLKSVIQLIIDDHWIQNKKAEPEIVFERFVKKFFTAELQPLLYLHVFFSNADIADMTDSLKALLQMEKFLLGFIKAKPADFQKLFLQIALNRMSELFELEHQLNATPKENSDDARMSLYRSFDILDQIFNLDYLTDEVAMIDQKERLYEGAGLGVQSSYATTVLALRYLNLGKGSKFIDLGSGYGRIGLVVGLMRPDVQFVGYEYVKERVEIANSASVLLKLDKSVKFVTQDLVQADFKVPSAETYYIFDSFTDVSYSIIMAQLEAISLSKKITVVTKGNAKLWMKNEYWSAPQEFNGGNICFFRSNARPHSS